MEHTVKQLASAGLHYTGLAAVARRLVARKGRFVLTLHDVIPERRNDWAAGSQKGLTRMEADQLLGWLRHRLPLLTPQAFLAGDQAGVLITVDDGKANHYTELLPLLERHRAPALFFVATQHTRRPDQWLGDSRRAAAAQWPALEDVSGAVAERLYNGLSEAQLRACDAHELVTIGAHSDSHPRLPLCSDCQLRGELVASRDYLEATLGHDTRLFAYPYGDYDERVARAVEAAGYRYAFAVDSRGLGRPHLEIPRLHIDTSAPAYISAKTSGLFRLPIRGLL